MEQRRSQSSKDGASKEHRISNNATNRSTKKATLALTPNKRQTVQGRRGEGAKVAIKEHHDGTNRSTKKATLNLAEQRLSTEGATIEARKGNDGASKEHRMSNDGANRSNKVVTRRVRLM